MRTSDVASRSCFVSHFSASVAGSLAACPRRLDHTRILGDTLEEIAVEKAGIFKPGVPALVGEGCTAMEVLQVSI